MKKYVMSGVLVIGLTGCITQLQEVPVYYADVPLPKEKAVVPPPPAPEKTEKKVEEAAKEEPAPVRAGPSRGKERGVKSGEASWTPAPRLNGGQPPKVTLEPLVQEKAEIPTTEPVKDVVAATKEEEEPKAEQKPAKPEKMPSKKEPVAKPEKPAPPAPLPAIEVRAPQPGQAVYFVRLGSFPNAADAEKLAWRAANEWDVTVKQELVLSDGKKQYQVHAGPYVTQQQADETARRLKEREKVHGEVFYIPVTNVP